MELELLLGSHLLGEERGLDAVEQLFEPLGEQSLSRVLLRVRGRVVGCTLPVALRCTHGPIL